LLLLFMSALLPLCVRPRTSGVQATTVYRAASLYTVGRGGAAGFRDFLRLPSAKENRSNRRAPLVPPTRLTPRIVEGWGKPRPAGAGLFLSCTICTNRATHTRRRLAINYACKSSDIETGTGTPVSDVPLKVDSKWLQFCGRFSVTYFWSWWFAS
jgi:hypothetical protein